MSQLTVREFKKRKADKELTDNVYNKLKQWTKLIDEAKYTNTMEIYSYHSIDAEKELTQMLSQEIRKLSDSLD